MMNDQHTSYRWQDYVITPRRAALNLLATAMIVAAVGAAGLHGGHDPDPAPATNIAAATESTPPLAHLVKRPAPAHSRPAQLRGC
jgi:hypothetical protein